MSEEAKKQELLIKVVSATQYDVTLSSGTVLSLKKLPAGPYYEAQKHYTTWQLEVFKIASKFRNTAGSLLPKAQPNLSAEENAKLIEEASKKLNESEDNAVSVLQFVNDIAILKNLQLKFVAACLGKNESDVGADLYPEDFDVVFSACVKLNNVSENVKNSAALIGLGA